VTCAVRLRGRGCTEVAAYGVADAEHRVETELKRYWPDAALRVTQVRRAHDEPRIAEEFVIEYLLHASIMVDVPDREDARRAAYRQARARLEGSRFWRVDWEEARVEEAETP
jgi:hypothetical protein